MDVFERLYNAAKTQEAKKATLREKLWKVELESYNNFPGVLGVVEWTGRFGPKVVVRLFVDTAASIEGLKIVALD